VHDWDLVHDSVWSVCLVNGVGIGERWLVDDGVQGLSKGADR
jgi:hypothetical protein